MMNQGLQRGVTRFVLALALAVGAIGVPQAPVHAQTQTQGQASAGAAITSDAAQPPKPRKLLYYRNPMGLADTSPTP